MRPFSKLTTRVIAAGFSVCISGTLLSSVAYAQIALAQPSENIQAARKAVTDGISGIKEPEAPLTPAEQVTRTRTLITSIVTLTDTEAGELVDKLSALPLDEVTDAPLIELREQFSAPLVAAHKYLDALTVVVKDTNTLEGLQATAGQLKQWRIGHGEHVKQAVDLIMTVQNRTAIDTARLRITRVSSELQRTKFKTKASQWQPLLTQANTQLKKATALTETAQARLLEYLPTQQVENAPVSTPPPTPTATTVTEPAPPSIQDLVQDSVSHIKETYRLLIEAIKKSS